MASFWNWLISPFLGMVSRNRPYSDDGKAAFLYVLKSAFQRLGGRSDLNIGRVEPLMQFRP